MSSADRVAGHTADEYESNAIYWQSNGTEECARCGDLRVWHRGYWAECQLTGPQSGDGCNCPQFVERKS